MKETLLKIAEYIEEQTSRLDTLERKVASLENTLEQAHKQEELQEAEIKRLKEQLAVATTLAAQPAPQPAPEVVAEEFAEAEQEDEVAISNVDAQLEQDMKMAELEARLIDLEVKEEAKSADPFAERALFGTPVDDIRHAISLGDRFLFQRELFAQNGELMQKTLETLNNQANMDEAIAYLDKHFADWDKESTAYQLFLNVLHRRF